MTPIKLYRFSPIKSLEGLMQAIEFIHFACYKLCNQSLGEYLPNAGNLGIFCHYDDEFKYLLELRNQLVQPSDDPNQKYFTLLDPITIAPRGNVPATTYTHLYIRKPDPYRHHVGDIDFFLEPERYIHLKGSILSGKNIRGARVFDRADLDMIELYDPDIDALGYISTQSMTEKVRIKLSDATKI